MSFVLNWMVSLGGDVTRASVRSQLSPTGSRGEGEWVHSGITEGATVHMGKIIGSNPHHLKLSWISEKSRIIHFANDL